MCCDYDHREKMLDTCATCRETIGWSERSFTCPICGDEHHTDCASDRKCEEGGHLVCTGCEDQMVYDEGGFYLCPRHHHETQITEEIGTYANLCDELDSATGWESEKPWDIEADVAAILAGMDRSLERLIKLTEAK